MTRALGPLPVRLQSKLTTELDRQIPRMLWLDDPLARDPQRSGSAAHLARLAERYPVPPGFVLSFRSFPSPPISPAELVFAYRRLATLAGEPEPAVVVHALADHATLMSTSRQPGIIANVRGVSALAAAIESCAAGALRREGRYTVVVQLMVHADVTVTAHSADPFTGSAEHVFISARWGLGMHDSRLGAGTDRWLVSVSDGTIITAHVGDKQRMTVSAPGGVAEVAVPTTMRHLATLTHEQIRQVATLWSLLRAEHSASVCVDAAFAGGWLSLLQCCTMTCATFGENEPAA